MQPLSAHARYQHWNTFTLLVSTMLLGFAPRTQAQQLFYVRLDSIRRASLDGSGEQLLISGLVDPRGLAIDPGQGKIYWSEEDSIRRCNLDGTDPETFISISSFSPEDIAIDLIGRKLYWTSNDGLSEVRRVNLDGSAQLRIATATAFLSVDGLTIDEMGNKVYWVEVSSGGPDSVRRCNLDGGSVETVLESSSDLMDVAIHSPTQMLYMTTFKENMILTSDLNSPSETPLVFTPMPARIIVDDQTDSIFWSSQVNPIGRANLDGTGVQTLMDSHGNRGLAIHRVIDCNNNGIDDWCDAACGESGDYCDVPGCGTSGECNQNGVLDACEISSGSSEDCNFNGVPDECEPDGDCNANSIKDICDIGAGTSQDTDGDLIPDECCPPPCAPDPLLPNTFGTCSGTGNAVCDTTLATCPSGQSCDPCGQVRYLSFTIPATTVGLSTAVRIRLTSLHNPVPPPIGTVPTYDVIEGGFRYLNTIPGSLSRCCNPNSDPIACNTSASCTSDADCVGLGANTKCEKHLCPDSTAYATFFRCGLIGCSPEYRDWSDFSGLVTYATGSTVIASSVYGASQLSAVCAGNEADCLAASPEIPITTERWTNVDCSNNNAGIPSAADIGRIVDKVKDAPGAFIKPRTHLRAATLDPISAVNAQCVGRAVDALKGSNYPFNINCTPDLCSTTSDCDSFGVCVSGRCTCASNADCRPPKTCSANGFCTSTKDPCTSLCQP